MYDEQSIKQVQLCELIYRVPDMFLPVDQWDNHALQVFIMLVVRQAVEPDTLNHPTVISVTLEPNDVIIVEDDGIGLPVAPLFEYSDTAALTRLLRGYMPTGILTRKRWEEIGFLSYFAMMLNCLSEALRIDTFREGQAYGVSCSRGKIITPLHKTDDLTRGTRIRFKPDSQVFPSPAWNEESLRQEINALAREFSQVRFE